MKNKTKTKYLIDTINQTHTSGNGLEMIQDKTPPLPVKGQFLRRKWVPTLILKSPTEDRNSFYFTDNKE